MDIKDVWTSLNADQASSWLHVISHYFFKVAPFFLFVPQSYYRTSLAAVGVLAVCHVCLNISGFMANKRNISERRDRLRLNIAKLKEDLKNTAVQDKNSEGLTHLSFDELSAKLKDGTIDQLKLIVAFLRKALEAGKLNAVTEYDLCSSSVSTAKAESTEYSPSALSGIPVSISDVFEINDKDRPLGLGGFVGVTSRADAAIVKTLKAAGAIPFIRTNNAQAHPLCLGLSSSNPIFGQTLNPADVSRSAGGGSCGEACALCLHISALGVGADLVGGARVPAHFCGVAALRPSSKRLSSQGLLQGQNEVAACVSPMSRDVSGLVAFMRAACGAGKAEKPFDDEAFSSSKPLRIGYYTEDGCTRPTPPVSRAVSEAKKILEKCGHKLVQFEPPDMKHMLTNLLYPATMGCGHVLWQLLSRDVVDPSTRDLYYRAQVNNAVRRMLAWWRHRESPMEEAVEASAIPECLSDWWKLTNEIQDFREMFMAHWRHAGLDALLCPVFPCAAVKLCNEKRFQACLTHVGLFSLVDFPAGTLPLTRVQDADVPQFRKERFKAVTPLEKLMTQDQVGDEASSKDSAVGLPVGVQVAALPFQEETVLRVMSDLERLRQRSSFSDTGPAKSTLLLFDPLRSTPNSAVQSASSLAGSETGSSHNVSSQERFESSGTTSLDDPDERPDMTITVTTLKSNDRRLSRKSGSSSKGETAFRKTPPRTGSMIKHSDPKLELKSENKESSSQGSLASKEHVATIKSQSSVGSKEHDPVVSKEHGSLASIATHKSQGSVASKEDIATKESQGSIAGKDPVAGKESHGSVSSKGSGKRRKSKPAVEDTKSDNLENSHSGSKRASKDASGKRTLETKTSKVTFAPENGESASTSYVSEVETFKSSNHGGEVIQVTIEDSMFPVKKNSPATTSQDTDMDSEDN